MPRIIENPDSGLVAKWGPLGYVIEKERERILGLPYGQFHPEIERLKREIKDMKKKKKSSESEHRRAHRMPK